MGPRTIEAVNKILAKLKAHPNACFCSATDAKGAHSGNPQSSYSPSQMSECFVSGGALSFPNMQHATYQSHLG